MINFANFTLFIYLSKVINFTLFITNLLVVIKFTIFITNLLVVINSTNSSTKFTNSITNSTINSTINSITNSTNSTIKCSTTRCIFKTINLIVTIGFFC